jgi:hypothetical protein
MRGTPYTGSQLEAIHTLILQHGHLIYSMGYALESAYSHLTGDHRSSGALYMAAWRMEKGYYRSQGFVL